MIDKLLLPRNEKADSKLKQGERETYCEEEFQHEVGKHIYANPLSLRLARPGACPVGQARREDLLDDLGCMWLVAEALPQAVVEQVLVHG